MQEITRERERPGATFSIECGSSIEMSREDQVESPS